MATELFLVGMFILILIAVVMIVLLWTKLARITSIAQQTQQEIQRQESQIAREIKQTTTSEHPQQKTSEPETVKLPRPRLSSNARLENITFTFSGVPGVMGAVIADRFGQPVAVDSDLPMDKTFICAHLVELYSLAKKEKLSIGKLKNVILMGEGSYWIVGELVGMHMGLWLEKDIPVDASLSLFEDFKFGVANSLKNYYTKIW